MVCACQYLENSEVNMGKYTIKILSPVHIGNGNKLNQAAFLLEKNIVYVANPKIFTEILPDNLKHDLLQIAEKGKRLNLHKFLNEATKLKFKNQCLYKIPLASSPLHFDKFRLFEFDEFIKRYNFSYIPGSELKGAFRTAILHHFLSDKEIFSNVITLIKELKDVPLKEIMVHQDTKKNKKEKVDKIEEQLHRRLFRGKGNDAKYDILKLLQISDSNLLPAENTLSIGKTIVLGPKGILKFAIFQELLIPDIEFEIPTISFTEITKTQTIANSLGFSDIQLQVLDIDSIFKITCDFTREVIEAEKEYFQTQNANNKIKNIILSQLNDMASKNTPQTPVIRIGMGEGLLSHTIWLVIKKQDRDLYNQLLNLKKDEIFPKSRKLYEDKNGNYHTMGWVQVMKD